MKVFRHLETVSPEIKGSVIVLGNFDGFHKGHQIVVGRAGKLARDINADLSVLVLEPHPRSYFNPAQDDFRLTSFRTKTHLLENFGVDNLFVLPFDEKLSKCSAEDFIKKILIDKIGIVHVFVGYDYHFGAGRKGNPELLQQMGHKAGFGVTIVEKIMDGDHIYSSTNIRDSFKEGDVRCGADRLGHWWHVEGHVLRGDQRGRILNFPTANLSMDGYVKPKLGVYAVRVMISSGPAMGTWDGVANVGTRPTFDKDDIVLEAHIFDFDFDIYETPIKVEFVDFIRPEQKFDGLGSLKEQIKKDSVIAQKILSDPKNSQAYISIPRRADHI